MKIQVKLFASHRELAGESEVSIDLADNARIADLIEKLFNKYPDMEKLRDETIVSVNKNFAENDAVLKDGDEVAIFPPVSGG